MNQRDEKSREDARTLLQSIVSFLLVLYGFFMFIAPDRYPLPIYPQFTPQIGLVFMAIGLFLLLWRRSDFSDRWRDGEARS